MIFYAPINLSTFYHWLDGGLHDNFRKYVKLRRAAICSIARMVKRLICGYCGKVNHRIIRPKQKRTSWRHGV